MKKRFAAITLLLLFMTSCQTVKERELPSPAAEEENIKIKEWEEYMDLIGEEEHLPLNTVVRFTEAYIDAMEVKYKKEMEEYEEKLALYNKGALKTVPEEPVQDYTAIISRFRPLLPMHRYGEDADAIRYLLGYALSEQGEREEAAAVFEELIKNYPDSRYHSEASFRAGELYFETGRMENAANAYSTALNNPKSIFYDKALYKLGWAYYKLDEFKKAADRFISMMDLRREAAKGTGGLAEEGMSSIVMSLGRIDTTEAIEYLRSKGKKEYTPLLLLRLGDLLMGETRYDGAMTAYQYLAETFPENEEAPFVYERMAEIYDRAGDEDTGLEKRWEMVRGFNPTTTWYRKNYPSGSEKVDGLISKTLISVSKRYHYMGKREAALKYLERSIEGYRILSASFPALPEVNLLLAEALFDAKIYPDAAREYENAAPFYKEGAERGEIAHSAFLAHEVTFYQSPEKREETIKSLERLLETYRSDLITSGKLEKVTYRMAEIYSRTGAFDKARESLIPLVKGTDAVPAYKRIAELYILEGNLEGAEEVYQKLAEGSSDPAFREALAQLRYSMAEGRLKAGRNKEAAIKFNQSFAAFPGFKTGEAALIKLGHIYLQDKETDNLEETVRRLVKEYPGSDGAMRLLVEAGRAVEKEVPLKAAGLYEYASSITANGEDSLRLIFAAAILYHENGSYAQAEELLKRYMRNKWLAPGDEAEALYRLGDIQFKTGRKEEGIKALESLMGLKGKIDGMIMAKTKLLLAGERQKVYLETKLAQPFEKTLKKKTKLLNNLLEDYSDVARYGVPDILP
ncbi:MAG: tetratricopeptide repeat protein, partial [Deltaproteobacteria bacterium]